MSGRPDDEPSGSDVEHPSPESELDAGPEPSEAEPGDDDGGRIDGPLERWDQLTLVRAVAGITVVSVLLRLVFLGARPAHWDEARVAYWAHFYAETGSTGYHWEEHGPLIQLTARWLFEPLGVTDTATRLPVALVGGVLPSAAYLYREHLRKSEVVALALFLAANSVLLYYSRFMRSDVLVAAFMFTALGLLVRFTDTRRHRYLYGAGVFVALGFASKENAVIYILTWVGAAALVVDQWLHSPASEAPGVDRLRARVGDWRGRLSRSRGSIGHLGGAVALSLAVTVFAFADRGGGVRARQPYLAGESSATPLGQALSNPLKLPAFAVDTLELAYDGYADWFGKSSDKTLETYIEFVRGFVDVLVANAPVVLLFAILGFAVERYGRKHPRSLVLFFGYCAAASLVGYPLGTDISGAWAWVSTHIIVPMTVPAAVGIAWLYRAGLAAQADRDTVASALVALVFVTAALQVGFTAANDVYQHPQSDNNQLVQYAQPYEDLDPVVETLSAAAGDGQRPDAILYYGPDGEEYDDGAALVAEEGSTAFWDVRPTCSVWGNTQPLNWYFAVANASVDCERSPAALESMVENDPPPVIFAVPDDETLPEVIESSYRSESYYTRTIGRELVVYTHESLS